MDVPEDYILNGGGFTGNKVRANDPAWQGPAINDPPLSYNTDPALSNPDGSDIFNMLVAFNENSNYMDSSSLVLTLSSDGEDWMTIQNGVVQDVFANSGAPLGLL